MDIVASHETFRRDGCSLMAPSWNRWLRKTRHEGSIESCGSAGMCGFESQAFRHWYNKWKYRHSPCCPPELSSHRKARRNVFMDVASNVLFLEVLSFFVSKRGMPESVVMERAIMCLSRTRPRKIGRRLVHGNSSWTVVTNYSRLIELLRET